jgi:hypothetical protein
MVCMPVIPATLEAVSRRIMAQGWPREKYETLPEKCLQKWAGGVVQVVEYLPSKYEALS